MRPAFRKSLACAASAAVAFATSSFADDPVATVRVEEDWVLEVHEADPDTSSPQIVTQMTPNPTNGAAFALFCLNYHEVPDFVPGGMEIQLWGDQEVLDVDALDSYELSQAQETVKWTQSLKVDSGGLTIRVKNGESDSFGNFGGESFQVSHSTSLSNLDEYSVDDSVNNSGISLGANRVRVLKIVEVRRYKSDGSVVTDSAEHVVYQQGGASRED